MPLRQAHGLGHTDENSLSFIAQRSLAGDDIAGQLRQAGLNLLRSGPGVMGESPKHIAGARLGTECEPLNHGVISHAITSPTSGPWTVLLNGGAQHHHRAQRSSELTQAEPPKRHRTTTDVS